jgi:hypothetical protein
MMDFLSKLEGLEFSHWVLESGSIWAYPMILFMHSLGMAMVAGLAAVIDLRLLGLSPQTPVKPLGRLIPIMWWGFGISAVTGTILLVADATTKLANPDFYVKMVFVFTGLAVLRMMRTKIFAAPGLDRGPLPGSARPLAWISLVCWIGTVTAGRLLAYVGPVSGIPGGKGH